MTDTSAPTSRINPAFHYPIPRAHTGKLQFRIDRAEMVTIDRIGDVRRGQVIAVKRENFARGLIAGGSFANAPEDAPLGQPEAFKPKANPPSPTDDQILETFRNAIPQVTKETGFVAPVELHGSAEMDRLNAEHLATFDGTPESLKKSPK